MSRYFTSHQIAATQLQEFVSHLQRWYMKTKSPSVIGSCGVSLDRNLAAQKDRLGSTLIDVQRHQALLLKLDSDTFSRIVNPVSQYQREIRYIGISWLSPSLLSWRPQDIESGGLE